MAYAVAATHTLDKPILQALTSWSSTAKHDIGFEVSSSLGRKYQYTFVSTTFTVASIAAYPAFYMANVGQQGDVTTTHDADLGRNFAGVLTAIMAAGGNYGWIQTKGIAPSCAVSSNVSAENSLGCMGAGGLSYFPIEAVSTSIGGVTYDLTNMRPVAVAMEAATSGQADCLLL